MEIVRLVATGATNRQIARDLVISINTVKVHLRNIYAKLEVASRTEATMVAVRQGWVQVDRADDEVDLSADREATPAALAVSPSPARERWAPVSLAKRIALVVACLLALTVLLLPSILQGRTNGPETDPIGGVFPTIPSDSSTARWRTRAQMPTPRTGLAVVEHGGLVYAIGGVSNDGATSRLEMYDPNTDAWTPLQSKPTAAGFISAVEEGGKIYVPGGIDAARQPRSTLEIYDPATDNWQTGAPMPEPLGAYGLAALDGQIYLFGGRNARGYTDAVYRYDPVTDRWDTLQPMEQARGFLGAAPLGDRIYVVGGYDGAAEYNTCAAYDPAADSWTPCSPMDIPRGGLAVIPIREHLYAVGGGMDGYLAFNERYDPRVDAWSPFETPVREQWQGLGAAFVYPSLYALGGWNGDYLSVNEAYRALYQVILP
jgi:DNA-binding CsgD family transcriptional regulator